MAQQLLRSPSHREGAARTPRAPAPGRSGAAEAGGGPAPARLQPVRRHLAEAVACDHCQAINPHPDRWCVECGALLKSAPLARRAEAGGETQGAVLDELRRACKALTGITWLYRLGALAFAVEAGAAIVALQREDVPRGPGLQVVVVTTLLSAALLTGALQVVFQPLVWSAVVAALATLVAAFHLIGPDPLGLAALWSAAWAAAFWVAVWPALRIRRLIAEHTDLYIEHHASRRTLRALEQIRPEARHARLMSAMRRAFLGSWKTAALASGAICAAGALGSYVVLTNLRPEEFSGALAEFEAAWNRGDLAAVTGIFPPELEAQESALLARQVEGHGWGPVPPLLEAGLVHADGQRKRVEYELDGDSIATAWTLSGQRWRLTALELPTPPLGPTSGRFLQAWRASDLAAVAGFAPVDQTERTRKFLESSLRRRGWRRLPAVRETVESQFTERTAEVTLKLESGQVVTEWICGPQGLWHLQDIEFPTP